MKEENGRSGLVYTRGWFREQITTPIFTTLPKYLNHKRRSYQALFNDNPREVVHHGYDFINMPRLSRLRILIMASIGTVLTRASVIFCKTDDLLCTESL